MSSSAPPSLAACQRALMLSHNLPSHEWAGRCHEVCLHLLDASDTIGSPIEDRLEGAVIQRGRWAGQRTADAVYPSAAADEHSWLLLADGRIFDPTCWAFTGASPCMTIAAADDARWVVS